MMNVDDDLTIEDDAEEQEVESPLRSELALGTMCASVLRRVPSLAHVEVARIRHLVDGGDLNWELASTSPELDEKQWALAVQAMEPWRAKYRLADGTNATRTSSKMRKTPLIHRDLPAAMRRGG